MKPKILNDITNIFAKWSGSKDYDPKVKYETALEYYANEVPVLPKPKAGDTGKAPIVKSDGSYELKTPSAPTPDSIVTATGEMTAQQAADTLDNIGGEPEKLIVTVTEDGGVYSADKTFAEIYAALEAGKTVIFTDDGIYTYYLDIYEDDYAVFVSVDLTYDGSTARIRRYHIADDDTVTYIDSEFTKDPNKIIDSTSTSITLAYANRNTIYKYSELTSLTVTFITVTGDFIICFTSGSTPTVTNFPVDMVFPEAFAAEANTRYEINVSNGYAVVQGWPTT